MSEEDKDLMPALLPVHQDETIAMVRALCPRETESMSDMHVLCCYALVECKGDEGKAAAALVTGIFKVRAACRTRRSRTLMDLLSRQDLTSVGMIKARAALVNIVDDVSASPAARVTAAIAVLKVCEEMDLKEVEKQDGSSKELSDMTVAELEKFVGGVRELVKVGKQIKNTVDIVPSNVHLDQ